MQDTVEVVASRPSMVALRTWDAEGRYVEYDAYVSGNRVDYFLTSGVVEPVRISAARLELPPSMTAAEVKRFVLTETRRVADGGAPVVGPEREDDVLPGGLSPGSL